jgi:5-methylcytosine-specific restriction endonuclease McrA
MRKTGDNNRLLMGYVLAIFKQKGRDLHTCEYCGESIEKPILHHERYEGATIEDLKIVCQRCNTRSENKLLV